MRVSIVTAWKDHPELIDDYRSVAAGAEVVIVDNESQPENAAKLRELAAELGGRYLRNDENKWFSYANNQGFQVSTGGIVVFMNNDVSGPAIAPLVRRDVKDGGLYGVSLNQSVVAGRFLVYAEGWCIAATTKTWKDLALPFFERNREKGEPGLTGPWDAETFTRPYWEDNELCFRAICAGLVMRKADWPISHKSNTTSKTTPGAYEASTGNSKLFEQKVRDAWLR